MARFSFPTIVCGQRKVFTFDAPTEGQAVITNRFCPKEFLVPRNSFLYDAITPKNGEELHEFEQDCRNLADAMKKSKYNDVRDVFMDALASVVTAHVNRCGRLIFNDLLTYIDILCYFLYADGNDEKIIKLNYPLYTNFFFENMPNSLKDSATLQPLIHTNMATVIRELKEKAEVELGLR